MANPIRIAITGTRGQLARSLVEVAPASQFDVVAVGRPVFDLTEPRSIEPAIAATRPDIIVHAAAYTDIEGAELNPDLAARINTVGAEAMARCAHKLGIPLIHLSTAYVFDGSSDLPYREDDPINPKNSYGRSKADGEKAVCATHGQHVILRTSLVHSAFDRNFAEAIIRRAMVQTHIPVVTNQLLTPTGARDLARGILTVAGKLMGETGLDRFGIFHMASTGVTTPFELATAVLQHAAEQGGPQASPVPIRLDEYASCLARPRNAALNCAKLASVYGFELPDWRTSIADSVKRLLARLWTAR